MEFLKFIPDIFAAFPLPFKFFLLAVVILIPTINYYNDYTARKKRAYVLDKLHNFNQAFVQLQVKSKLSSIGLVGFRITWQRAEVILIKNSFFYFGYDYWLGFLKMYKGFMQLYLPQGELPEQMLERGFIPIESIKIEDKNLRVTYFWGNSIKAHCTMILKDIDPETFSRVKQLLAMS
ncbi:MAG: hypothetical protein HYR94_02305 [Chloroflexi bacterium]|nr:hypothetical protein [Chloroflexota bacterium]